MDDLVVCSAKGIRFQDFSIDEFEGSIGAIQACFQSGENIIAMDTQKDAMLCKRSSIQQKNIAALCCLPIIEKNSHQIIGLIYLDSKMSSKILSELDMEILNTINEQVLLNLQVINLDSQLNELIDKIAENQSKSSVVNQPIMSLVRWCLGK